MHCSFIVSNFNVNITKTDEGLSIKAENELSNIKFSQALNNESAKSLSKDQFDIDTLYQLLKDYAETKPKEVSVSLTEDGVLNYTCKVFYGNIAKEVGFTIQLDKQRLESMTHVEEVINNLSCRVIELEKAIQASNKDKADLEAVMKANDKRYQTFETLILEKVEKLFMQVQENVDRLSLRLDKFDDISQRKNALRQDGGDKYLPYQRFGKYVNFSLSDDHKTALSQTTSPFHTTGEEPLPKQTNSSFTFKIQNLEADQQIMVVGILPNSNVNQSYCFQTQGCFGYTSNGTIQPGSLQKGLPVYKHGDKVSFAVDLILGEVNVLLNGRHIYTHTIPKHYIESCDYYPCLFTNCIANVGAKFI